MATITCSCFSAAQGRLVQPLTGQRAVRPLLVQCKASMDPPGSLDQAATQRRAVLGACILGGLTASLAAAAAPSASLEACSNFTTAANGIKWCDTRAGSGVEPKPGQLVRCHYTGRLTSNGRVFDSSYERRRPLTFKVGAREVIQGWDKSILGEDDLPAMKEGGTRRVIIPPQLAYGSRGAGGVIPPNATLTFDIELLGKR